MFSFSNKKKKKKKIDTSMKPRHPRLERRNANNNIDYDHHLSASFASPSSLPGEEEIEILRPTKSLDLSLTPDIYSSQTSFRIDGGIDGAVDLICRNLGLSGPEDFAVPSSVWEANRTHHSLTRSRLSPPQHQHPPPPPPVADDGQTIKTNMGSGEGGIKGNRPPILATPESMYTPPVVPNSGLKNPSPSSVLAPPPSMSLPVLERFGSNWDLVRSFAPNDDQEAGRRRSFDNEEEEDGQQREEEEVASTSDDDGDDTSSSVTEVMFVVSPNGRFKRNIRSWMRGQLLGSGSFGTVYEGISE